MTSRIWRTNHGTIQKKVKFNTVFSLLACIILAVISALSYDVQVGLAPGIGQHGYRSFVSGASCGMAIVYAVDVIRNILALRSEKKLKKMYIKANDERYDKIWNFAQASASQLILRLEIVAIFVSSYFNMTVGVTVLFCALIHALCVLGFKIYYSRKY